MPTHAYTDEIYFEFRDGLARYFRAMSAADSVTLHSTLRPDEYGEIVFGRLCAEELDGRVFYIDLAQSPGDGIDAFTKQVGIDFEFALLNIFTSPNEAHFPALWMMYVKWIHERADADTVLALALPSRFSA